MAIEQSTTSEPCQCRAKAQRFSEYVRLHASQDRLITEEAERSVLRTGVGEFSLSLDEARGILFSVADDRGIALESQADKHVADFLVHTSRKGRVSHKEFDAAVEFYRKLTRHALSESESRARVKKVMERNDMKPRRNWARLGSRRWYDKA
ncbi:MAG: hypothetical protein ABT940_11865 [Alphaproteobacteria bacterium]